MYQSILKLHIAHHWIDSHRHTIRLINLNTMKQNINTYFESKKEYGVIFVRVITGFHLIYGVQDNVLDWGRMLEFKNFLQLHHFPVPLISAIVSVYAQLVCGMLFIAGAYVRAAAVIMIFNFIVALTVVHHGDPYPEAFPALMMLCSSLFLLFHGAGKLAIDKES